MKKIILALLAMVLVSPAITNAGRLKLSISGTSSSNNRYYLCVYGLGCINMRLATATGKEYPIMETQMWNMKKLVVANGANMRVYRQPNSGSCKVNVGDNQRMTMYGQLSVRNNTPYLSNVRCSVR